MLSSDAGNSSTRKAQVLLEDFVISLMVFTMVVAAGFKMYYASQERESWSTELELEWHTTMAALDYLIKGQGVPADWNYTNVERVGLATRSHVVSVNKFLQLMNLSYEDARAKLGVGGYDYYLTLKYLNDTVMEWNGEQLYFGMSPPPDARTLNAGRRYVYVVYPDGSKTIGMVELGVWR